MDIMGHLEEDDRIAKAWRDYFPKNKEELNPWKKKFGRRTALALAYYMMHAIFGEKDRRGKPLAPKDPKEFNQYLIKNGEDISLKKSTDGLGKLDYLRYEREASKLFMKLWDERSGENNFSRYWDGVSVSTTVVVTPGDTEVMKRSTGETQLATIASSGNDPKVVSVGGKKYLEHRDLEGNPYLRIETVLQKMQDIRIKNSKQPLLHADTHFDQQEGMITVLEGITRTAEGSRIGAGSRLNNTVLGKKAKIQSLIVDAPLSALLNGERLKKIPSAFRNAKLNIGFVHKLKDCRIDDGVTLEMQVSHAKMSEAASRIREAIKEASSNPEKLKKVLNRNWTFSKKEEGIHFREGGEKAILQDTVEIDMDLQPREVAVFKAKGVIPKKFSKGKGKTD